MSKKKAVYNPDTSYKWDPLDVFEITGQQFASIYHALNKEVNDVNGASIAAKYEAFTVMMDIFKKYVEEGVITETQDLKLEMVPETEKDINVLFKA